jgi:hypothetical protein
MSMKTLWNLHLLRTTTEYGKHLLDKLWCYDKNELPGSQQQAALDMRGKQ